jgi:LDH2 family malate/lactate/ureidoglycolate dehydrogenase
MTDTNPTRYAAAELRSFGIALLTARGMREDQATDVAEVLLEADLLGHTTHGLNLLGPYLEAIEEGNFELEGEPEVVADHGSAVTWDGRYLAGPWLLRRAISDARERLKNHPVVTWSIRRSHHIACLQAYLKPVTDEGLFVILSTSDPSNQWVAPHGAVQPRFSPNPIAAGIPTGGDPWLIDVSISSTAAGKCIRATREGERLPGKWLVDSDGNPTDDPAPMVNERKGALYPLGGPDLGYKGFGLALLVEAMTSALGGFGRADCETRWNGSVFLQIIDPARFGGSDAFVRETEFLSNACREAAVPSGAEPVRMPGERALKSRSEQLANGVVLYPGIISSIEPWAAKLNVALPNPLQ